MTDDERFADRDPHSTRGGIGREMGRKAAGGAVSAVVRWGVGFLLVAVLGTGAGVWAANADDEPDDDDRQTSEVDDRDD